MAESFGNYVAYLLITAGLLIVILVLLIGKFRKRNPKARFEAINCGTVSVLFDRGQNVIIIPYTKDKYGMGKAVTGPCFLTWPYTMELLGKSLRDTMKLCVDGKPCSDVELMNCLGSRSWKEFSEGKRNISVHYQEGHGVVFNTTRRRVDGSYQFNSLGFEKVVKENLTDRELGELLSGLAGRCRA